MDDLFDLARFVTAQDRAFAAVVEELAAGRKQSHWMWFVFPQIAGLGSSAMAVRYAIGSLAEARAYLDHPILGPRLRQCTALVNKVEGRTIRAILGQPDDLKFRSSVTLFARATAQNDVFIAALDRYFGGEPDAATQARLV
jgi:uncharacterized protein (DUF1810 family)